MPRLSICINTQTPLVQFRARSPDAMLQPVAPVSPDLSDLKEGVDFRFSPGGVTRMVYPLVRRLLKDRVLSEAHWVSLNPNAPPTVRLGKLTLHNVNVDRDRLAGYGQVKEAIWSQIHGLAPPDSQDDLFWTEAFSEYAYYNRTTAELIRTLDRTHDFDVFYIHDFQQMAVGQMLGTVKPKVFRWHIPFDVTRVPDMWKGMMTTYLNAYDVFVVSAQSYARSLESMGPHGRIVQMNPYVDPGDFHQPPAPEVAATSARLGLAETDEVVLVVARMDPMKGQDVAIRAFGQVRKKHPRAKLVFVGNGSFSASRSGLGLSKADVWRARLENLVREAGLGERVLFTGHLDQPDLDCLYERCVCTVLPSSQEGFGLVAVESWLHGRPSIVTRRAGVAELMTDGVDGLLFDPTDASALARAIGRLLGKTGATLRGRLVRSARALARKCSIDAIVRSERELLLGVTEAA